MIRKLSIKPQGKSVTEMYDELIKEVEGLPEEEKKKEIEGFTEIFGHDMKVEDGLRYGTQEDRERDKSYGRK